MTKAVERYKAKIKTDGTEERYIQYGSTFFNTDYVDYLDANFEESAEPEPTEDIVT